MTDLLVVILKAVVLQVTLLHEIAASVTSAVKGLCTLLCAYVHSL